MHVAFSVSLSLILETAFLSEYLGGECCEWNLDDPEMNSVLKFTPLYVDTNLYSFILFR